MYELVVSPTIDQEISIDEYSFVVNDLLLSIIDKIEDVSKGDINFQRNIISFESSYSENEIKKILKPVFSHHFEILRFVSLRNNLKK